MPHLFSRRLMIPVFALCCLLMLSGYRSLAADATPTTTPTAATPLGVDATFGSGSFDLPVSTIGLSTLSSYRATLLLSFKGTQNGKAMLWSRTYVMLTNHQPAARQLAIDTAGKTPDQMIIVEVNGAHYERDEENTCTASMIEKENAFAERWEPAGLLTGVLGAEEAGSEAVNGVASNHYTFDESAFGQSGRAQSKGDVWIATDGGYIVQYMLVTQGNADYFGEGIEGVLTWDYKLSDVNQPLSITLPEDCPAGMVDVPLLTDATDILRLPSMLSYNTNSSLIDTITFYQDKLPALSWQLPSPPTIAGTKALLKFTQGDMQMSVMISTNGGITTVNIVLKSAPKGPIVPTKIPTRTPVPTRTAKP
jgi:hypothetical protein